MFTNIVVVLHITTTTMTTTTDPGAAALRRGGTPPEGRASSWRCAAPGDASGERVLGREERSRGFFLRVCASTRQRWVAALGSFDTHARARIGVGIVAAATHHPRAWCRGRGGYV